MVLLIEFKRCHFLKIGGFGANVVGRVILDPASCVVKIPCFSREGPLQAAFIQY